MTARGKFTFVLPGRNLSGGCRVTVGLANELLAGGYQVRIAHPFPSETTNWREAVRHPLDKVGRWASRLCGRANGDWVQQFAGGVEAYHDLDKMEFAEGEVVIAVGSFTVEGVRSLAADVVKLRFCHGFQEHEQEWMKRVWSGEMPTIAVTQSLIPRIVGYGGGPILGVVPNAIDAEQYFVEERPRTGIGTIYGSHSAKAPQFTVDLLKQIRQRWPDMRQYVFGAEARPAAVPRGLYWRAPSVAEARELYNRCLIWLVTSHNEGFALPILEAMACGCAVISTATLGGQDRIEHEVNGLVVPVGDAEGFMREIERVLGDDGLRQRLVAGGRETARQYTWKAAADRMEAVLGELAAAGSMKGR